MLLIYCPDSKIAMPDPTPSSALLPSVYICIDRLCSFSYVLLMLASAGCCQYPTSISILTALQYIETTKRTDKKITIYTDSKITLNYGTQKCTHT